jgi:hypothetical protein
LICIWLDVLLNNWRSTEPRTLKSNVSCDNFRVSSTFCWQPRLLENSKIAFVFRVVPFRIVTHGTAYIHSVGLCPRMDVNITYFGNKWTLTSNNILLKIILACLGTVWKTLSMPTSNVSFKMFLLFGNMKFRYHHNKTQSLTHKQCLHTASTSNTFLLSFSVYEATVSTFHCTWY